MISKSERPLPKTSTRTPWNVGDTLIWDNRCLLHCGNGHDADRWRRGLRQTRVAGLGPTIVGDTAILTGRWSRFLTETDAKKDHVERGDLPEDLPWAQLLAEDALALTRRLGWVMADDVSHAGHMALNLGKRPPVDRD